jgi:DNA replication protein DnaC
MGAHVIKLVEQPAPYTPTPVELDPVKERDRRRFIRSLIPVRANAELYKSSVEITSPMRRLMSWNDDIDEGQTIAVLHGPPGTGKTLAAHWFAVERALDLKSITASDWARQARYERDELVSDETCSLLIFDDLGVEALDAKLHADLEALFDRIYRDQHEVIITTNLAPKAFAARYGERITDRLAECAIWIPFTGPSRRRAASSTKER